jgi:hypothetical protein
MPCGEDRFEKEAVNRFVRVVERRQVDLPIPSGEELVVGGEVVGETIREKDTHLGCAPGESGAEITSGHLMTVSEQVGFEGLAGRKKDGL